MTNRVSPRLLQQFEPLGRLSDEGLSQLAASTRIYGMSPGHCISLVSTQDSLIYLIKGSVDLYTGDNLMISLCAGEKRGRYPLRTDDASYDSLKCTEAAYVAVIERETLNRIMQAEGNHDELAIIEVSDETDLDTNQSDLLIKLYTAYQEEALELPSMPEVALKLREATRDPDVSIDQLVRIIQADAAIAGSLLHAANGPLFCSAGPVKNLRNAVVRLGVATTQSLATAVGLFKVFYARNPTLRKRINQTWQDSLSVSGLAYCLTKHLRCLDPDRALLAGLLHRVGAISVLGYMDANGLSGSDSEIDSVLEVLNRPVGILVMNYWEMGDDLINVVEEYNKWDRTPDAADYCDIVQLSWIYHAITSQRSDTLPDIDTLPAAQRLGIEPSVTQLFDDFKNNAYGMTDLGVVS